MSATAAFFYDGKSSKRSPVSLQIEGDWLHVSGEGIDLRYPVLTLRVSPPLGRMPCSLRLPDGAQCELQDCSPFKALAAKPPNGTFDRLLHRWESRLGYVFLALALTLLTLGAGVKYAVPWLAEQMAFSLPASTEHILGQHTLQALDRLAWRPSRLAPARQRELADLFQRVTHTQPDAPRWRLELRQGKWLGANAFALPAGIIVLTDELVLAAQHEGELIAVLAHEMGHLRHRHSLRSVLQSSATGLIVAAITGDIFSASSLAAALPTALIEAQFSRHFEHEADDFAVDYLKAHHIPLQFFADLLLRLEHDTGGEGEEPRTASRISAYLSTHPVTSERIDRFTQAR